MQQHNEIQLETHDAVTLMDIKGDITAFSETFLNEAYQKANDRGASKILLKIDKDAYINSGGIALLIQILAQTKRNNQQIGITGISDHFEKIFHMVGITKFANIYASTEDAIKLMSEA
ncbi:MAG: STAS domain-containing protein [Desulfobacterales bacterium]|jgi:anti-anti-sigma factor